MTRKMLCVNYKLCKVIVAVYTHHGSNSEDVTVMTSGGVVFGNIGEVRQIVGILARAVDVPDLVFADQILL